MKSRIKGEVGSLGIGHGSERDSQNMATLELEKHGGKVALLAFDLTPRLQVKKSKRERRRGREGSSNCD